MTLTKLATMGLAATFAAATPSTAVAQADAEPPTVHHITTSTFHAPYGDSRRLVMNWIEDVMVPLAKMNDDVLSFRVAVHSYGTGGQIVLISEYASWDAINATCEPCRAAFEEMQPEEGTPEREEWDANLAAFLTSYSHHKDEMYQVNMDTRAK